MPARKVFAEKGELRTDSSIISPDQTDGAVILCARVLSKLESSKGKTFIRLFPFEFKKRVEVRSLSKGMLLN